MNTVETSLKSPNDEKQHICETCEKSFKSKSALNLHRRNHSGENLSIVIFVTKVLHGNLS